jgi:hypothetical protein
MQSLSIAAAPSLQVPPAADLAAARAKIVALVRGRGTVPDKAQRRRIAPRRGRHRSERSLRHALSHALRHAAEIAALGVPVEVTVRSGDLRVDLRAGTAERDEARHA